MRRLLIISFDAVGDVFFDRMKTRPHFKALAERAVVRRGVDSVFVTNTYPVHTSVITGVPPGVHGLTSNTDPFPSRHPRWRYAAHEIKAETLWQRAKAHGLTTATVLWPVTGGAKEIRWNIPEILTLPGESQVRMNLRYGSKWAQIKAVLKHRDLMKDIPNQPALDNFAAACMTDFLRTKKPGLALVHFTVFDTFCHEHGIDAPMLDIALDVLDANLGKLLAAAGDETDIILFSDHAQLDVSHMLLPNELLLRAGYIETDVDGAYRRGSGAGGFFECAGGCAFLHPGRLDAAQVGKLRVEIAAADGFARFLTEEEMRTCGHEHCAFGFAARPGWSCESYPKKEEANHGYPLDNDAYKVFYMTAAPGFAPGESVGGSLLDIAPMAAEIMGLS